VTLEEMSRGVSTRHARVRAPHEELSRLDSEDVVK
jgi:hypothetical protein